MLNFTSGKTWLTLYSEHFCDLNLLK